MDDIDEIKKKGEEIYEKVDTIVDILGSDEYLTFMERFDRFFKKMTFIDYTVYKTDYKGKELKIKVVGRSSTYGNFSHCRKKKVFYDDELVFSGAKIVSDVSDSRYGWYESKYEFDKIIICEWVKKIDELEDKARKKRRKKEIERAKKRKRKLKESFQKRCNDEVLE
ncbi:MAG: hypothetical protein ACOC1X_02980 [Promethearchaeota archaeon]